MASPEDTRPGDEPDLPRGASPLDLLLAREAAARTAPARTPAAPGGEPAAPERRGWSAASKLVVGLGAVLLVVGGLVGAIALLGGGDSKEPPFAWTPTPEGMAAPGAQPPDQTGAAGEALAALIVWHAEWFPHMVDFDEETRSWSANPATFDRATACAALRDNVAALRAVGPAPDAALESDYRAVIVDVEVGIDECERGNFGEASTRFEGAGARFEAMEQRMDELSGE